jgi:putative methyltransferase (TIGR04325 family)
MAGFDHADMTDIGHYANSDNGIEPMPATEYPALFWLRQALDEGARTLLDFGGYVGHGFHQYDQYLKFPDDFSWTVYDLPEITKAAEKMARRNPRRQLNFSNRIDDRQSIDILLAAGSLQYVREGFLPDLLEARRQRPRHVIVQRTPLHAHRTFVTIQSIITRAGGVSFCPYTVARREEFISSIVGLGYELIDSWEKQREIDIPFEPEFSVGTYSGLYFRLRDT